MTILLCSLSAVIGAALGYLMARPRKVRPAREPSEALASYARQSGENAARAVS